ncbi:probable ubiquitin-like-specific protease 2B [Trifolium pratense]|nr:probable ubiquitin-like-specific protease 2B [Trifolium pratense]
MTTMMMMNAFPPRVLESLDSMDSFDNSSLHLLSRELLEDNFEVNDFDGAVNLEVDVETLLGNILDDHTNSTTLENCQHQNEPVYIDLEADECVNYSPPGVLESLDSMDAFDNSSASFQSHEFLNKLDVNDLHGAVNLETDVETLLQNILDDHTNSEFEAVKLSNSTTLENRQHQTEPVYINLEADECVNYSTPPSYVSDIAADATFSHRPTPYFPDFQEHFDEFVYPKGDPDSVCITRSDVDQLKPDTYINDTIIDFYILYLKNKMKKQEKPTFHFFNSFFFPKLACMDKNSPSAFQSARKWTRKINLFEKDYIFIPVNFKCHWSLIVICYPGEVVNINDTEPEMSLKLPCILHMDSFNGYHSGLKDLVQSYLCEEWKERKKDTCGEDLSSRFLNMRFLPVEVPQQENSYDCGLFLLHYLELFLDEAQFNFNPLRITKFSNFLNSDWFPPAEASLKRTFIRRLIFELMENHGSHEGFSQNNGEAEATDVYRKHSRPYPMCIENIQQRLQKDDPKNNSRPFPMSIENIRQRLDDPLIYFSQHSNTMCAGNRNWSPTLQLHQVDNMILEFWEEQPAKKRRLMHFPGGSDGIPASFTILK